MATILDYPLLLVFPISFAVLAFATWLGGRYAAHSKTVRESPEDFNVVQTATLTLPAYIGLRGWVGLRLYVGGIDWSEVAELVTGSYRLAAPKRLAALVL